MSLRVDWTPRAQRDLARLDQPIRSRIVAAVLIVASIVPVWIAQKLAGTDESVAAAR